MLDYRVLSSAGRASPLQGEGRGFEPLSTHHMLVLDVYVTKESSAAKKSWSGSSVG